MNSMARSPLGEPCNCGVNTMTKFFRDFLRDDSGASAAEYALILAIVGAGIAGAAFGLGESIEGALDDTANKIALCGGSNANTATC